MVTPYAAMVDGIIHSEEKNVNDRIVKLEDADILSTDITRIISDLSKLSYDDQVMYLKKILVFLRQDLKLK